MLPELTLLIPCYNEELILRRKIKNCLELSYPQIKEIVIVDDFSTDKTAPIAKVLARKEPKITFLSNRFKKGKAGALLTGIKYATTDLICVSDADVLLEKKSLKKMISLFNDPKVGMVGGSLKPVVFNPGSGQYTDIRGLWDKIYFQIQKALSQIDSVFFQHGQFFTLRKSLYVYPRSGIQTDDTDLSARIRLKGFRSVLAPQSFFWEEIIIAENDFAKRFRRTQGIIKTLWQYRHLFLNPKFGRYGLICYPASFFLYLIQPLFLFLLTGLLWAVSPLLIKLLLLLIILFVPPIKKFFYMDAVIILAIMKLLFSKKGITDSWDTQRTRLKACNG